MEYVTGQRQVVLNFSELYCKSEIEILNSACFADIWARFVKRAYKTHNAAQLVVLNVLENPEVDFINLYKLIFSFEKDEIIDMNDSYKLILDDYREQFYDLIEAFYDFWRSFERYGVILSKLSSNTTFTSLPSLQSAISGVIYATTFSFTHIFNAFIKLGVFLTAIIPATAMPILPSIIKRLML